MRVTIFGYKRAKIQGSKHATSSKLTELPDVWSVPYSQKSPNPYK